MSWVLFVLTLGGVALCFFALSVRVIFKKDGQFSRRCASQQSGGSCRCQEHGRHEDCPNYQLHHGNTATRVAKAAEMAAKE